MTSPMSRATDRFTTLTGPTRGKLMMPATPAWLEYRKHTALDKLKLEMAAARDRLRMMGMSATQGHNTMLAECLMSCHP